MELARDRVYQGESASEENHLSCHIWICESKGGFFYKGTKKKMLSEHRHGVLKAHRADF